MSEGDENNLSNQAVPQPELEQRAQETALTVEGPAVDPGAPGVDESNRAYEDEFSPTTARLILERDGVIVEGLISVQDGAGVKALLFQLHDELVKARATQTIENPGTTQVDTGVDPRPDPREAAALVQGHVFPQEPNPRCVNCGKPEWQCLEGEPCTVSTQT